jgi:HTH-type transcriptional regulator/antitoxin HigA
MEAMSELVASPVYSALLTSIPPRVIRSEQENESYIEALYRLEQREQNWSEEEREFAALLTLLIENFEEKYYALPKSSPIAVLKFLMDQHGLKQKDLVDIFGTPSIVSEVLSGKRDLNKEHIRRLSKRFGVSPELFF